jgi:uncharacterized protein
LRFHSNCGFIWRNGVRDFKNYNIEIYKLANGKHNYSFEVDDAFFALFEGSLIERGEGVITAELEKTDSFIKLEFDIEGIYELICDRSLENYFHPYNTKESVIFKFGDEEKELDDDVFVILKNTQRLNVAQLIYELISITIPMKKLHPKFADEPEGEDILLIYTSLDEEPVKEEEPDKDIDPRWLKLKNLRNKKNNDN